MQDDETDQLARELLRCFAGGAAMSGDPEAFLAKKRRRHDNTTHTRSEATP